MSTENKNVFRSENAAHFANRLIILEQRDGGPACARESRLSKRVFFPLTGQAWPDTFAITVKNKDRLNHAMRNLLLCSVVTLTLTFSCLISSGQDSTTVVTLEHNDTTLTPLISKAKMKIIPTIRLLFKLSGKKPDKEQKIDMELQVLNAEVVSPVLKTTTVSFVPDDWNGKRDAENNVHVTKDVEVELSSVSSFGKDVLFFIVIKGKPAHADITISSLGMYTDKPFWVEVGSNFDFADGLKPNNFFGGVFLYDRDIRPIFYKRSTRPADRSKNLGIFAGVFESKTISDVFSQDFTVRPYYNSTSVKLLRSDSVGVFRDTGRLVKTQVVKNIGLFVSPQVRLTDGSSNAEGAHVFLSTWMELQWQRLSVKSDFTGQARYDTLYSPRSELNRYDNADSGSVEKDIRTHYFGFGLPIYYKKGDANLFLNPVIGFSNQPLQKEIDAALTGDDLKRTWRPFYIVQFRLSEEKYGISFTGEVRGLIRKDSRPFVSLALSKKFDLTKFIEFK